MASDLIEDNIQSVITNVIRHVPRKNSNISSISIKTDSSTALPIYNKLRDELEKIEIIAKVEGKTSTNNNNTTKGKKRVMENDIDDIEKSKVEETEIQKKKQKKEASLKSPLLKALKQKKQIDAKEKDDDEEIEISNDNDINNSDGKKKQKKRSSSAAEKSKDESTVQIMKIEKQDTTLSVTKAKKKSKTTTDTTITTTTSTPDKKVDFIASKKYQGSKKGFVFKMGVKGVGYYIDVKPVVNKMALEAFVQSGSGSKGNQQSQKSRRQSTGKVMKKGRGKGRRSSY